MENKRNIWNRWIEIGISEQESPYEQRKTRLLNVINILSLLTIVLYALVLVFQDLYFTGIICLIGLIVFVLPTYLNHIRKFHLARLIACIGLFVFFATLSLMNGEESGMHYAYLIGSIMPLIFFEKQRLIIPIFILSIVCFMAMKYYNLYYPPLFPNPFEAYIYYANMVTFFVILFLVVYKFKNEHETYEKIIEENRDELLDLNGKIIQQKDIIEVERLKSEKLLLNILPDEVADELKETGKATPKHYDLVTVLFTDFKGFTQIAEKLSPQVVIEELNKCFFAFDEICDKYNLEKIKTIGDAYMCAGGLPMPNHTNPVDTIKAGLEMQVWMANWKAEKQKKGEPVWELRLGIHSGSVVAGVVGKNKFAYDIWGDTVNLASRMESSGEVGKVNISGTTYQLVKDVFHCEYRGKIEAKNKGEVEMYFVSNSTENQLVF